MMNNFPHSIRSVNVQHNKHQVPVILFPKIKHTATYLMNSSHSKRLFLDTVQYVQLCMI